jgi:signal transduction histidine kinase
MLNALRMADGGQSAIGNFRRRDATLLPVEYACHPIGGEGEARGTVIVFTDLTERQQLEKGLQENEAAKRALLSAVPDIVFRIGRGGIYLDYRAEKESDLPAPPHLLLGKTPHHIFPPELAGQFMLHLERAMNGGGIQRFEYNIPIGDEVRHREARIVASGAAEALIIVRDLTALERARETVRELQAIAESRALLLHTVHQAALDILAASETGAEALRHLVEAARMLTHAAHAGIVVERPYQHDLPEAILAGPVEQTGTARSMEEGPTHHGRLSAPIARGDIVLGTLRLAGKLDRGAFTESDAATIDALAAHAAVVIHHLHLLSHQRALVSRLIEVEEEERRRVAYELHDGLTQYVMAAHAHLEAFQQASRTGNQVRAAREQSQGLHYLKDAVVESRRLVNGLRPLALDDLGLAGAMEQLLAEEKQRAGWEEASLAHNIPDQRFDSALETAAYRVAQEALTNSRRHAATPRVHVELLLEGTGQAEGPRLSLEVRDWGRGFVPEPGAEAHGHLGLHGMRERVSLMEGACDVRSLPGQGTVVRAVFPVRTGLKAVKEQGDE